MDCGPSCLKMICSYYKKNIGINYLHSQCQITKEGVSLYGIANAARELGLKSIGIELDLNGLIANFKAPCILHWKQNHFVVLYEIKENGGKYTFCIGNPCSNAVVFLSKEEFVSGWLNGESGIALFIECTSEFNKTDFSETLDKPQMSGKIILNYIKPYKKTFGIVIVVALIISAIQFTLPFLSQHMVDSGIVDKNIQLILFILFGQVMLEIGQSTFGFIRSWLLLKIGLNVNVKILSDYLLKLMSLPISFFDTKFAGDIMQRVNDHYRIQYFLTDNSIDTLFSVVSIIVLGIVITVYNSTVSMLFFSISIIYILWILLFLKKRAEVDNKMFMLHSSNQNDIMQLIYGMQEIKLNGCEQKKLSHWQEIQYEIKDLSMFGLKLSQYQQLGGTIINQVKNLVITAFIAILVVKEELTLGVMLSIQYIIGILNMPINQIVNSIRQYQDASLSMKRLTDVYELPIEDVIEHQDEITEIGDICINHVSFKYDKFSDNNTLDDIDIMFPYGKTTAIVGLSGSGKTTLLKLVLGFYKPDSGDITINGKSLELMNKKSWRQSCGIVMQDGFLFSDTILNNIVLECEFDQTRFEEVVKISRIDEFVNELPLQYNTLIGNDGKGISVGQKQRILIARALYKAPQYILFDEATNSLDAENEHQISEGLVKEFTGKTVLIIAHRLSTIKNADQIIVMNKGRVVERGSHSELISAKGLYYNLVKEQINI